MFDVDRQTLIMEVRCLDCRASLTVNSDDQTIIQRSIAEFKRRHYCRLRLSQQNETKPWRDYEKKKWSNFNRCGGDQND